MCAVVFLGSVIRVVQVSDYVAATEARITDSELVLGSVSYCTLIYTEQVSNAD
jgi:hypothetical protein